MSLDPNDHNRGGYNAFLFAMVFTFAFFVYVSFIHPGVELGKVREESPGAQQQVAAAGAVDVSGITDPWVSSDALIAHGHAVYKNNCAVCHGDTGLGNGPAGASLNPPPRNFVEGKWTKGGDTIALYTTVQAGIAGSSMAPFGHLPKTDRWALVHYIRSLTKNKVADDASKLAEFAKSAQ